jgi:acyl carrier protein
LLIDEGVTVVNQTPSAFKQLIEIERAAGDAEELKIREVIFGGEKLDLRSVRGWGRSRGENKGRIVNMYGITETTVHVTQKVVREDEIEDEKESLIGRGIEDMSVYLLDSEKEPVVEGVIGEMYVGGGGVTRGYLGRAELTAERFLPDPFSNKPGSRMYKSGDLGREIRGGEIEYIGRGDGQVKIRGYRIEVEEIEWRIKEVNGVKEAAVIVKEDEGGEKRLVGYAVMREGEEVSEEEIRRYVKEKLPEYMVPVAIMKLGGLPMTENGKLDRGRLPDVVRKVADKAAGYEEPRTAIERELAAIWSDILGVEQVGAYDNFFDLGGHSLLVMQTVARVREAFSINLPLASIFESPTLANLANIIEELRGDTARIKPQPAEMIPRRSKSTVEQIEELSRLSEEEAQTLVESESHQFQQPLN